MIATSDRPALLRRTLASLGQCDKPANYVETVVIENGSRSGTEEVVRNAAAWLRARYIFESKPNKSAALNRGLAELGDCVVFFTDDDARFHPSVLRAYNEASERFGKGHFYGGPTAADYEIEPAVWLKQYLPPSARGWRLEEAVETVQKPDFLGFNWAAFATDLQAAGGFDPNRGPGSPTGSVGQEKEMQQRLLREELKAIYVPEALVWHYVPEERCSPKWVLNRGYQSGIQAGIEQSSFNSEVSPLFGYPRWAVREWIGKACAALVSITSQDPTLRFDALYQYKYFSGLLRGMRVGRKIASQPSNSHPSKPAAF
jgi:glycosyltransferase involved in cell wall biosynthesis